MADSRPEILVDHGRVVTALNGLGLAEEEIQEAVQKAYSEVFGCTAHDPRGLPGFLAYGKTVRHFRDEYVPKGWSAECRNNFELTVAPDGELAIIVWAGTVETGTATGTPTNRNPKGPLSRRMATVNQASFADVVAAFPRFGTEIIAGRNCWVLLHYLDRAADEIRVELSFPIDYSEGYIRNWGVRIILGAIPVGPVPFPEDETDDNIDIEVARRREA